MPRFYYILLPILVGLAGVGLDVPVQADMVSYTVSTSPNPRTTDFTQALTVPTFDRSMGTLTQVELSYTTQSNFAGTVTNNASSSQTFVVTEATKFTLSMGGTALLTNTVSQGQTFTRVDPGATKNFGPFTQPGVSGPMDITSGAIFNAFEVPAHTTSLTFGTLTDTRVVGGGGNATTAIFTTAGASLTVEFFFIPGVPEPSSIAMTAMGVLLAGSCWQVKKRQGRPKTAA